MSEELKKLLEEAKSDEERKAILEAHNSELTDEELKDVAGGRLMIHCL